MTVALAAPPAARDWQVVGPWYRWARRDGQEPERAAEAGRPALHKYASPAFVGDFLRNPQRSVAFDADLDVYQRVEPIPAAELHAPNGRLKSLSTRRLVPTTTRKLFLAAHQRFYLVAVGVNCDEPGYPRVDPRRIAEVGFVIRRHRALVPQGEMAAGAALLQELASARATAAVRSEYESARSRARVLHPFRTRERTRVVSVVAASTAVYREVELARRRLRTWAEAAGVEHRTEGWVVGEEGSYGAWVAMPDSPDEVVERTYPMRLLTPVPDDPDHPARDGTIYYGAVPTASDEITADGSQRFNERDTYEIAVFVRVDLGDCPGPLVWSAPSRVFRIASLYDPTGCAQRPTEIRMPDFQELEASSALPSVRVTSPNGSLAFSKFGETPTKGKVAGGFEICFFSIPLITIIAMFVLNLFLPVVMFVFQLWWMLKLKFCIPPSVQFEADLAAELDVTPPELSLMADVDIDVLPGVDQNALAGVIAGIFNPAADPDLDPVPAEWMLGNRITDPALGFSNDPLVKLAIRNGYGSSATGGAPRFGPPLTYTAPVSRAEVVHP